MLLGGTAEQVTRSISGTKASHLAIKSSACCIAISLACLRSQPLGNLTPNTSKQWEMVAFGQSRSLPVLAANTSSACILATPRFWLTWRFPLIGNVVLHVVTHILSNVDRHLITRAWTFWKTCMANQTCVAPNANILSACGTLHAPLPSEEVMVASMCVTVTIRCNNCDHMCFVPCPMISGRCLTCQWCLYTREKG